ncbi:MAG TPA: biotin transporter BioY [Longimicrobiales bacterium]|nr:biotin transporter BioY [Longimicrobiales bacterium]
MTQILLTARRAAALEVVPNRNARRVFAVAVFVMLTALGAYAAVPMPGSAVPVTLQTLFVSLAGVLLGARLGAVAMTTYVLIGLMGAPVFSLGFGGPAVLLGPTGGYLLAFPLAAAVTGMLAPRRDATSPLATLRLGVAILLGTFVVFAGGFAQLALLLGDPLRAFAVGVVPFLIGDVVKTLLALLIARRLRNRTLGLL